ncbi:MAG: molecular chaperone DnaJ [Reyranellaceae bacterium]
MPVIILAFVVLGALALVVWWLLRANPSTIARILRPLLMAVGLVGVAVLLIFGVRFLPGLIPELFGLAGIVATALIARWLRKRPTGGGFSVPGGGQRTEVHTVLFDAWIDHGTGDVGGAVRGGRHAGRTLDSLSDAELLDLHAECAADPDSLKVLEAYLDRRLGADWRTSRPPPPRGPRTDMTREEALSVLGLAEGATDADIKAAHRRLIQRVHPDVGGSADLAARINRAKDVLLGG